MSILYPLKNSNGGFCYPCSLRIIPKFDVSLTDLKLNEIVISKDFMAEETLVGLSIQAGKIRYEGRLYQELLKLDISTDLDKEMTLEDKQKIVDFVSKYSRPYGSKTELSAEVRANPLLSWFGDGDNINWLFINYVSKPQDPKFVSYFYIFRAFYIDFVNTFQAIKSNNYAQLDSYQGVFNHALSDSQLYLPSFSQGFSTIWTSNSCMSLCFLELYDLLMSKQKIKTCIYCGDDFESSKSNESRCLGCRNPQIYRALYYKKNIETEREKARIRMAKNRGLDSY